MAPEQPDIHREQNRASTSISLFAQTRNQEGSLASTSTQNLPAENVREKSSWPRGDFFQVTKVPAVQEKNLIRCFHQHQSLVLAQVPLRKRTGNPDTGEGSAAQSLPKDPRSEFVEDANKHTLKTQTTQFFHMGKILT